ncbi:Rpn family recombination-promoting nuclease/putative transposase [Oceanobacillus jeddahense]|uniref:Rpn family recombination-promoting nuclease/putative transposase n=1 Tax=Oceanobacillus jeddahense TaxID=1462527 RepID=A0ABY5JNY4_9BACI|nr:Rpn family recombination-promoting nuclease/putative transposase [Oceanobacillus jeddahense]UUI01994.1 Rpn family recombination-promoting nuclease/putative transposase [Oceanobacillus jeddahense]
MVYPRKAILFPPQIGENGEVYKDSVPKKEFYQLMDLKIDYAFRKLFGDQHYKKVTIAFLNALFIQSKRAPIKNLTFQNWRNIESEESHLNLLVETEDKKTICVEILFPDQNAPEKQSFYFWPKIYRRQFEGNSDFKQYDAVVTINILNFELFHESDEFHHIFRLAGQEEPTPFTKIQEYQFVEIPKFIHHWNEGWLNLDDDALPIWLLLLAAVDSNRNYFYPNMYRELEKIAITDKNVEMAMKAWRDISHIEANKLAYQHRQKQIIEQQFLKEVEIIETKRKITQERTKLIEQKYNQIKKQYEQQKLALTEEKEKRLEAEENAVLANREAAKIIIRYGKVVARNLFEQGMERPAVKNITGLSDKELAELQEELEEE